MSLMARLAAVLTMAIGGIVGPATLAGAAPADPFTPDPAVTAVRVEGGGPVTIAEDVNTAGTVVGRTGFGSQVQAYAWSRGQARPLDPPNAGGESAAYRVNRRGDVLVQTRNGARLLSAGRWQEFPDTAAVDLNEAGDVLLYTPYIQDFTDPSRVLLWTHGRLVELLPPGTLETWNVVPAALNNAGQVLLRVYGENLGTREGSFVWTRGRFVQLQPTEPGGILDPLYLDGRGRAVGLAGGPFRVSAATWDSRGRPSLLALPEGATGADPRGVNAFGQVVGYCSCLGGTQRIVLWTAGRPTVLPDLPGFGLAGDSPVINDLGQVAWVERSAGGAGSPVVLVWWFGREVLLGPGTVSAISNGGFVVGNVEPNGVLWSVDWRAVFARR